MRATEHAPRDPFRILESRHGLAEIVERGTGVLIERPRVIQPRPQPGHEATQWVVDAFVKRLPEGVVVTQGGVASAGVAPDTDWAGKNPKGVSRGVGREVAAAAELGVLRGAAHAVLVTGSTFSEVAMRWRTQSNQSAPVVVRLI